MQQRYQQRARSVGLVAILVWGCDGPVAPEEVGASPPANPGESSTSPNDSSDSSRRRDPIDSLPGVAAPRVEAPEGCLRGLVDGALTLSLDAQVPTVQLEGADGKLLANGIACTDAQDVEVALAGLASLHVQGDGPEDKAVIVELGSGDWSALLATSESIQLAFSGGENSLVVRGTSGADRFHHGMLGSALALDLIGDGRINLLGTGLTELGVSLEAGDDALDAFPPPIGETATEDTSGAGAEDPPNDGEADATTVPPSSGIAQLSIPLVVTGGEGNDSSFGGSGNDTFEGGPGDDTASGLSGNDIFLADEASDGTDTENGGSGYDQVSYELRLNDLQLQVCLSDPVLGCGSIDCGCTEMSGEDGENDRLIDLEDITGGDGNDTIYGSSAAESLSGGPGQDSLFGRGGSDVLYGERDEDVFDGGLDGDYCDARPDEPALDCEL